MQSFWAACMPFPLHIVSRAYSPDRLNERLTKAKQLHITRISQFAFPMVVATEQKKAMSICLVIVKL